MRCIHSFLFALIVIAGCKEQQPSEPDNSPLSLLWEHATLDSVNVSSFAIVGTKFFVGTYDHGIFLTTNNGSQWIPAGLDSISISCLIANGTGLFAGTQAGIFHSTDDGVTWTERNTGLTHLNVVALTVIGQSLFAGSYRAFRSTNNGSSWTEVSDGLTLPFVQTFTVSFNGQGETNIFAGTATCDRPCYGGIYLSSNNGTNWSAVDSGLNSPYVLSLATSGGSIFAGTDDGVILSTNSGKSWIRTELKDGVNCFAITGTTVFAGTYNGVFVSTDGNTWTTANAGLANAYVRSLVVSGAYVFAGTTTGVFKSALH